MTFRNIRFPTGIRYGSTVGPSYSTAVAKSISGRTGRNKNWTYPLRKWRVDRALRTDAIKATFLQFFHNVNGAGDTFRIRDATDYIVGETDSPATGVFVSLGSNQYQMYARYTFGSYSKDVPVYLPVVGTIEINNGAMVETTDWQINYTQPLGIVTAQGSPGGTPVSWKGQYDVHARFESDDLPITFEDQELYFGNAINIIEERV